MIKLSFIKYIVLEKWVQLSFFFFIKGQPKGILRTVGGHLVALCWTMKTVYGMNKDSVWWVASDMGWVVGHSYICYGPLLYGITSVMYEGKPDRTPDAAQYFRWGI